MLRGQLGKALVEGEGRHGSRWIVRVVDPEDGDTAPGLVVEGVEIREEAALLAQGQLPQVRAREQRSTLLHGIARLRDDDRVLRSVGVEDDLGETEDRLLAAEGRDHLAVRIDIDAEAALEPTGNRPAKLREPLGLRIAHALAQAVDQGLPDRRVGRLARVALAEVDDLDPGLGGLALRTLEPEEGVRRLRREDGRDVHRPNASRKESAEGPRMSARAPRSRRARRAGGRSGLRPGRG